jgi:uncharacterized membrane protein YfcA
MDIITLGLFLVAAFAGGLVSGISGFAMGLVVSGAWLHIITPSQNALLIVLCGLVTQGSGIWRVRHAIAWRTVLPFIIGGAIGVALGTALLTTVNQTTVRITMGVLLVVYSLYGLLRPSLGLVKGSMPTEVGVGVANGLIGGLTGLGGIAVTIWCQLGGGPKDSQRAIFQPVMFATFVMTAISFGFAGAYTLEAMKLYALALPALTVGIWCGLKLYGKLDDAAFRRIILVLLLAAGVSLIAPAMVRWTQNGSIAATRPPQESLITARLPLAIEPRNNCCLGETQTPRQTVHRPSSAQHSTCRGVCAWTEENIDLFLSSS